MDYISIFSRADGSRLAILQHAYDIGYKLTLNGLHTATFTLPAGDPKNIYCQPMNYVEIWDEGRRVELFRILPAKLTKSSGMKSITYTCEHVMATLIDDVLYRYHEIGGVGTTTAQCLRYILDRQTVARWSLQTCAYSYQYAYGLENENLLAALNSIVSPIVQPWMWKTDTTEYGAWMLSVVGRSTTQRGELRYGKNLQGITKTVDPTNLVTRLYMLGYGEGDNQLTLASVTGGTGYIESDTVAQYGVIAKLAVDKSIQDASVLLETARAILAQCDRPYVSYEIDAAAIGETLTIGDTVRVIDDEEGISELMPVVSVEVTGINGARSVVYEIANRAQDVASTIADIADRQRISDLYSQGSTNIDSLMYADNAAAAQPATLRLYVSDKTVRLNAVNLTFKLSPFRAYSKSTVSDGGSRTTSSGGGGTTTSTNSGGGTTATSAAAGSTTISGGSTVSSTATMPSNNTVLGDTSSTTASSGVAHKHYIYTDSIRSHTHNINTSHSHSIGSHSHSVTIPAHSHSFSITAHTHTVDIPSHNHDIAYGIYTGASATSATIKVDGTTMPGSYASGAEVDIIDYLSVDGDGRIQRGAWHEVQIIPNGLTRIEAALQSVLFVNPRGGRDL